MERENKADGMEIRDRGTLTPREAEAVLWIAAGKTAWEAGKILQVTEHTLTAHARSAAEKLGATNRAHLVARAFVSGVLAPVRVLVLAIIVQAIVPWTSSSEVMRPPLRPATTSVRGGSRREQKVARPAVLPDT